MSNVFSAEYLFEARYALLMNQFRVGVGAVVQPFHCPGLYFLHGFILVPTKPPQQKCFWPSNNNRAAERHVSLLVQLWQLKRMIVELYAATIGKFNTALAKDVRKAVAKILFLNSDLWTSKVSGDKYIGE